MIRNTLLTLSIAVFFLAGAAAHAGASSSGAASVEPGGPSRVELAGEPGKWRLLRNGEPYFILGGGGQTHLDLLARLGGNSIRTWGADDIGAVLDKAHQHGLTVTVGIWLEHPRHGFNYNDPAFVATLLDKARAAVQQYKDHPALLMWGVGNEMEGEGKDAAIWSAVNSVASLIKQLDPNHPTMTVIAEIGEDGVKARNIHRLCPDIDVIGINAYGGGASVAERYAKAGGTKPFVITEFGPKGAWEIGRNAIGAPVEATSNEKVADYVGTYTGSVKGREGRCLGSYAFLWGNKVETTTTWFGLLLPDGTRLAATDALSTLWTGKAPANRCPEIRPLTVTPGDRGQPGATVRVALSASDPDGDTLAAEWTLLRESGQYVTGGDHMATPETIAASIVRSDLSGADIRLPSEPGMYRVYAIVRDGKGNGATASLPLLVDGPAKPGR